MNREKEIWSNELKMPVKVFTFAPGILMAKAQDGVTYSPAEMRLAMSAKVRFPLEVHILKKTFGAQLVDISPARKL